MKGYGYVHSKRTNAVLGIIISGGLFFGLFAAPFAFAKCEEALRPSTPKFQYWWNCTHNRFDVEGVKLRSVLDEASSHLSNADISRLAPRARIKSAMDFVHRQLKWDKSAADAPSKTFSEALDRRQGNCQHFAMLTVAILREAGYPARLVYRFPEDRPGHIWAEVEMMDADRKTTWVFDPTTRDYIRPIKSVLQSSSRKGDPEAEWYGHPDRRYLDP